MLMIRLQRTGRENLPSYRLVVAEKARPVKGKFLEIVGHYLPARDPVIFEHRDDRIQYWIGRGATPSNTVARLLNKSGLKGMDKFMVKYTKRKSKKEVAAAPEAPAAAATAAPAVEAPAAPAESVAEAKPEAPAA